MNKCIICDKETKNMYSIDIDLPSFAYCKKHQYHVQVYVTLLMAGGSINPEQWLKNQRKNESKGDKGAATKKGK